MDEPEDSDYHSSCLNQNSNKLKNSDSFILN